MVFSELHHIPSGLYSILEIPFLEEFSSDFRVYLRCTPCCRGRDQNRTMLFARASTKDVGKMRVADLLRVGNSEVELREVAPLHPLLPGREPSLNIAARCPAARSRKASELPFREARNSLWFRLGHPVELRGVEPRSRQAANMLSTRLASRSVVGSTLA